VETELPTKHLVSEKINQEFIPLGHSHDDDMKLIMMPFCRKVGRLTGRPSIFRRGINQRVKGMGHPSIV